MESQQLEFSDSGRNQSFDSVMETYRDCGLALWEDAFSASVCQRYQSELQKMDRDDQFVAAGIGRGASKAIVASKRSDRISWIPDECLNLYFNEFYQCLGKVMAHMNQNFYCGLRRFEIHGAIYGPGQHYERHLDCHRNSGVRVVTAVFYLNQAWLPSNGGVLRVFNEDGGVMRDILPLSGRLLLFDSARFEHEVTESHRDRYSLTGWFRRDGIIL